MRRLADGRGHSRELINPHLGSRVGGAREPPPSLVELVHRLVHQLVSAIGQCYVGLDDDGKAALKERVGEIPRLAPAVIVLLSLAP